MVDQEEIPQKVIAQAERVRDAVLAAVDILPTDDDDKNPPDSETLLQILPDLVQAQKDLKKAWGELQQTVSEDREKGDKETADSQMMQIDDGDDQQQESSLLRADYIAYVTDAFADELQDLQESSGNIDIEVLADCLQSGLEIFPEQHIRDLIYPDETPKKALLSTEADDGVLTPHQRRRKQRGFK
jgi:hypothetical protein